MPTHVPLQTATPPPIHRSPVQTRQAGAAKRGREGPSAARVRFVSPPPRHLRVPDHRSLHPWTPPYPERGGSGPASRPLGASILLDSWAGQATLVPRPNLVSHSAVGGASAVGAVGFGSCCWGAASADDVVVAPFLLIPSSFEVEEPHSQCQAHRYLRQAETLQTSVHIIVYSLLIRS